MLLTASSDGGRAGRNLLEGRLTITVFVLLFRTNGDKWNPVEAVLLAPPAQDSTSGYRAYGVVLVVGVDLVAGEDCGVAGIGKT